MENTYRKTNKSITSIYYNIAFCPIYKRKIFKEKEVEELFANLVKNICLEIDINLIDIKFPYEYCVVLKLESPASFSPHEIVGKIKNKTSNDIRKAIKTNREGIWTRAYLITTEEISDDLLEKFLELQ